MSRSQHISSRALTDATGWTPELEVVHELRTRAGGSRELERLSVRKVLES